MTNAYLLPRTDWYMYSPENEFTRCRGDKLILQCCTPKHAFCNAKLSETVSTGTASGAYCTWAPSQSSKWT
eukprot:10242031-Lingulodinium_polyedra.AAC.1